MKKSNSTETIVELKDAALVRGGRTLWQNMSLSIKAGEFIAVLGPNGAGKTSLLKVLLGLLPLSEGSILINNQLPRRGNKQIGYIPQQKNFDPYLPIRGRDLVQLGLNGHRYGLSRNRKIETKMVEQVINSVGASDYSNMPIGLLSGGEQQRLRIAQSLVSQPKLLLCDEPLLSLDLSSQSTITGLISDYQTKKQAAVIFVTHEINPILPWVSKVLYMVNGRWTLDTPDHVLSSKALSKLYDTPIEVLRLKDRVLVVGADDESGAHHDHGVNV
jgi:zinc/manganese transport system ATP-binding protein